MFTSCQMKMAGNTRSRDRLVLVGILTVAVILGFKVKHYLISRRKQEEGDTGVQDDETDQAENAVASSTGHQLQGSQKSSLSPRESMESLAAMQRDQTILTSQQAQLLITLLRTQDYDLLQKTLVTIANKAAFTENQNLLREAGCTERLCALLKSHAMALRLGQGVNAPVVNGITQAVNNLSVNAENQPKLKECIPSLIDYATSESSPEVVQLASLQALTNLSLTSSHHQPYTRLVQQLYEYVDSGSATVRLQAVKLLVNLSSNAEMVPHLLAAKAPSCTLDLLTPSQAEDVLLRWLTFLANVLATAKVKAITAVTLPTECKAPSPETMYTGLYGVNNCSKLKSKVFVLCKHSHTDIRQQASRIYATL